MPGGIASPYPTTRSPGFGAPLALGALGALAVLVHIRRQKP